MFKSKKKLHSNLTIIHISIMLINSHADMMLKLKMIKIFKLQKKLQALKDAT